MNKGHRGVRLLIEATAKSLADDIDFFYARTSDFNQIQNNTGNTSIVLDPLTATPQYSVNGTTNYMKAWSCSMAFYRYDKEASTGDEYALILDQTDELVDKFVNKLNFYSSQADHLVIQSISQQAFIKATSKIMTGHLLNFTILAEDEFEYCEIDCAIQDGCATN